MTPAVPAAALRTLIVGAGEAGQMVAREIAADPRVAGRHALVGFVDDDRTKSSVAGLPVHHAIADLPEIVRRTDARVVVIAIPSASQDTVSRIVDLVVDLPVRVRIVPGAAEIVDGDVAWRQLREVRPEDLLGREEVTFERERLAPWYEGQTVVVTGGGGSIGSELVRQLLELPVERVVALGHGENSLYLLEREFVGERRLVCELADVQDEDKVWRILDAHGASAVFHAAAHKHVPLLESFPDEALKNNVFGTLSVADAALAHGARRFVLVSTDKAVNPTSVMGASKRVAERFVLGLNGVGSTSFAVTRFGNVLGSRGSVLPLFQAQIKRGGPVTLTHPDIERYFMSVREAARLVLKAATEPAGRVFVLDMGKPVKIRELAERVIRLSGFSLDEMPIEITGMRPGEKLFEELLTGREALAATAFARLFISDEDSHALGGLERKRFTLRAEGLLDAADRGGCRDLLFEYAT